MMKAIKETKGQYLTQPSSVVLLSTISQQKVENVVLEGQNN